LARPASRREIDASGAVKDKKVPVAGTPDQE